MRDTSEAGRTPHLGLGLYIVRMIAEYHGGRITAQNLGDGSGVVFSLRLRGVARQSIAPVEHNEPD